MKLNHLNLTVTDVLETYRFLEKYFGLKQYGTLAPSKAMGFMSDDNGLVLALFRGKDGKVSYPPGFHVGFVQESEVRVNEINARLQEDGFKVPKPARMHGSWTFYFNAPGGFMVEVLC
jgi:lactoylglutathione lyase